MANCNTQQLNITCGTDVVLHDRLIFEGETFDPNLSVGIAANLVSSLGKRTALDVQVVDDELLISVPWIDGTLPGCYGLEVTGSCNSKKWATYADSLIRYTKATRIGVSVVAVESDSYDITQEVGYYFSDSPISRVEATIDDEVGEPSVNVAYEHKVLSLAFHRILGDGILSIAQTETSDESDGVNVVTVTTVGGKVFTFQVRNGSKGDTVILGEGVEYTLYNGLGQHTDGAMTQKKVTDELVRMGTYEKVIFVNGIPITWSTGSIKDGAIYSYANKYTIIDLPSGCGIITITKGQVSDFNLSIFGTNDGVAFTLLAGMLSTDSVKSADLTGYTKLCLVLYDKPSTSEAQAEDISITYTADKIVHTSVGCDEVNPISQKTISDLVMDNRLEGMTRTYGKYVAVVDDAVVYGSIGNTYCYTDFIYVGDCEKIRIPACYGWGCVFFDKDKQYDGHYYHTDANVLFPVEIDVPASSHYVQVNLRSVETQFVECYMRPKRLVDVIDGEKVEVSKDKFTLAGATESGYLSASEDGGVWTTEWHSSSQHGCTDYIDIKDAHLIKTTNDVYNNFIFFDGNKECCGNAIGAGNHSVFSAVPPSSAKYVRMNYEKSEKGDTGLLVYSYKTAHRLCKTVKVTDENYAPLRGLKVAWYGSSIPHGYPYQDTNQDVYSYANRAVKELGGEIQNRCVSGGFLISATNTSDTHGQSARFVDADPEGAFYSPVNYITQAVNLVGTDDEPDIFVFDFGANDGQYYQSHFDAIDLDSVDITSLDITTFVGAYNTVIKALLTAKPSARIFLVTHYSDDGQDSVMTRTDGYKKMNRLIEMIADYWHIPCNSMYKKTGWIYGRNGVSNIKSVWCKDGIHPASQGNKASIDFLTAIHVNFLKENS